ncbi:MAG: polysaccharide biosynthesis tyrosine autokinase [Granulicella sp.]
MGVSGARASGFSVTSSDTSLSEVLITLRKRRWIVIVCVLAGLFYGLYRGATQTKLYVATGEIQVRTGSSNEYRVTQVSPLIGGDAATKLTTEVGILKSETLLLTVARDLNLANDPNFLGGKPGVPTHYSLDDPSIRQATVSTLQNNLSVNLLVRTDIIRISYSSLNAKLSADIVNKVISEYIQRSYETRFTSTQRVTQWLSGQLDDLKQQVETSEAQMIDVQKRLGIIGLDPTHSEIITSVDDLSRASGQARVARILAESRYRTLSGMGTDAVDPGSYGAAPAPLPPAPSIPSSSIGGRTGVSTPSGSSSPVPQENASLNTGSATISSQAQGARAQLNALESQYAQVQATLGPNHPTVKALKAQIDELTKQVAQEQQRMMQASKEAYLIAQSSEKQTASTLGTERDNAYKLRDDLVEYTLRQREYESNRVLYDGLRQRLRAAGVQAGLESLEIDVVDQALPPANPTLQSKSTILIIALAFGLMAGIALAFLLESLDTGLRSIAEIEAITELPSLAIIPRARKSAAEAGGNLSTAARNISVLTQPKSQFAEAIRSLRTSLLLSTTGHPPKFILFTSATPSEGKTTTASNLACILAQPDTSVLLIDADLRRPNIHHRFGLNGKVGVTTLLTGSTTLENTVQRVPEVPNLHILPSGPVPPFPTEMLTSQAMDDLLEQCGKLYTHIVIDTPPILSVTDGVLLARKADAVALVIRHGKSSKHVVRRARDLLMRAGAPIAGIVLNAVDLNAPEYYGYYGYSGYSYSSIDADSWESKAASSGDTKSGRS